MKRQHHDHDDVHRAALRATAKVALTLTAFGCGGRVIAAPDEQNQGGEPPATTSGGGAPAVVVPSAGGAPNEGGGGDALACIPTSPGDPVSIDPAAFGCCVDYLGAQPEASWLTPGDMLVGCCHEVVGQIDLDPSLQASVDPALVAPVWPEKDALSCCDILGNPCSAPCGCTVWGPPMPRGVRGLLSPLSALEAAC